MCSFKLWELASGPGSYEDEFRCLLEDGMVLLSTMDESGGEGLGKGMADKDA